MPAGPARRSRAPQVPLHLAAIAVGVGLGALLPSAARPLGLAVESAVAALLLVTFLGVLVRVLPRLLPRRASGFSR